MKQSKTLRPLYRVLSFLVLATLFSVSCKKENNGDDNGSGNPKFEMTISGHISRTVKGDYAYVQFSDYQSPSSNNQVYTSVIGLSSTANELVSLGVAREGGLKKGTYDIALITFAPFSASFADYTDNNGANVYGPVSGTITYSQISDKHVSGSFNVVLQDNANTITCKGTFYAVKQ